MLSSLARRNARLVIAATFFKGLLFVLPVWLLYGTNDLHYSAALSVIIFPGFWFVGCLFEIPTGALADRLGRKPAFIIGSCLETLFPIALIFNVPLAMLIPIILIAAFGYSLTSGALNPLVHNSFEKAKVGNKSYNTFVGRNQATIYIARIVGGIGGAALYTITPWLPLAAWAASLGISAIIGCFLIEEREVRQTTTYRAHVRTALSAMRRSDIIVNIITIALTISLVTEAIWTGYQIFYVHDGYNPLVIGALFSIIALLGATSSLFARHLFTRLNPLFIVAITAPCAILSAYLLFQPDIYLRLLAVVPLAIAAGLSSVTITATIQHIIPNKIQSTALSIYSMLSFTIYFIASLWIGVVFDNLGVDSARMISLLAATVVFIVVIFMLLKSRRQSDFLLEARD